MYCGVKGDFKRFKAKIFSSFLLILLVHAPDCTFIMQNSRSLKEAFDFLHSSTFLSVARFTLETDHILDELGQRTVARLIIRLCINTGKQTDHPS